MGREDYLLSFLRGCAHAADEGEFGEGEGTFLIANGDLMNEAADMFEKLLPERATFKDAEDELHYNLIRAEQHARQAHDLLYRSSDLKRSVWFKMAVGRAQSILMSLYQQELGRRST